MLAAAAAGLQHSRVPAKELAALLSAGATSGISGAAQEAGAAAAEGFKGIGRSRLISS